MYRNPRDILKLLDEFGIASMPHTDAGLADHLLGTCEILSRWGCSAQLSLVGLCHSVYGTESYERRMVPLSKRTRLREIIGARAEYLTYLFGAHEKDSLWENLEKNTGFAVVDRFTTALVQIDDVTLSDLITVTLANWLEQRPRTDKKFRYIRKVEFIKSESRLPPAAWQEFRLAYELDER